MGKAKKVKFYAVRAGGIYTSWKDALEQVNGYRGAIFQSFTTKKDSERLIAATTKEKNENKAAERSDHEEMFAKDTENGDSLVKAYFLSWQKSLAYSLRIFVDNVSLLSPPQRVLAAWFKIFN